MEINPLWILVCIGIPLFGVAIFAWGLISERRQSAKKIEDAKSEYQQALSRLQESPGSEEALHEAQRRGQAYADLVMFDKRDNFDEAALLRDLNATRPASTPFTNIEEAAAEEEISPAMQQIAELKELREKGLITDAEYHEKRLRLIDEL